MTPEAQNDLLVRLDERTERMESKLDAHVTDCASRYATKAEVRPLLLGFGTVLTGTLGAAGVWVWKLISGNQ
ncbi:MAG: hypothetical protein M0R37_13655 [Bacteroidales bacterium]|jgi:hypothetical protein|nr:hypothetical protein [Sphaerochaeta sp.]MCK9629622.1 hypothetical protein [Bacteroidales bacterium]